jgi:nucleoside-diphosphate-sugar epimerase
MQFTVLGASGFIGSHLASRLAENGHQVFRASRGDLNSLARQELGYVFYCIGEDDAKNNPFNAFDAHLTHLASTLRHNNFRGLTYLSSTRLYLGAQNGKEETQIQIFADDQNAIFNAMKIAGEQLCLTCNNPAVRAVRLSNVIGFAPNGISLIPTLIRDAFLRGRMRLTISPESSKDYIAIEDVLDILPRIALEGKRRCYNLASGINVTLADVVRLIRTEFPSDCDWQPKAPTILFPVIDTTRVRAEFSFSPRPVLDALISACTKFRRHLVRYR